MDRLWQILLRSVADEGPLSCDDCVVLMDYLSDLLASNYPSKEVLALAERYMQRCPDCQTAVQQALSELTGVRRVRSQPGENDGPAPALSNSDAPPSITRHAPQVARGRGGVRH